MGDPVSGVQHNSFRRRCRAAEKVSIVSGRTCFFYLKQFVIMADYCPPADTRPVERGGLIVQGGDVVPAVDRDRHRRVAQADVMDPGLHQVQRRGRSARAGQGEPRPRREVSNR